MSQLAVRNIDAFNTRVRQAQTRADAGQAGDGRRTDLAAMPYIVVVVDEFADLMLVAGKEIEAAVQRLAQMARAAGIHLIMATQRPSVDIVTGTIKANFPTRISYKVASKFDSRTILNEQGAEQLLGQGDMLFSNGAGRIDARAWAVRLRRGGRSGSPPTCAIRASPATSTASPIVPRADAADAPTRGQRGEEISTTAPSTSCVRERQGLHQLSAAAPIHRLQPGRRPDRAHGAGTRDRARRRQAVGAQSCSSSTAAPARAAR